MRPLFPLSSHQVEIFYTTSLVWRSSGNLRAWSFVNESSLLSCFQNSIVITCLQFFLLWTPLPNWLLHQGISCQIPPFTGAWLGDWITLPTHDRTSHSLFNISPSSCIPLALHTMQPHWGLFVIYALTLVKVCLCLRLPFSLCWHFAMRIGLRVLNLRGQWEGSSSVLVDLRLHGNQRNNCLSPLSSAEAEYRSMRRLVSELSWLHRSSSKSFFHTRYSYTNTLRQ